jgi:hypothetical protein
MSFFKRNDWVGEPSKQTKDQVQRVAVAVQHGVRTNWCMCSFAQEMVGALQGVAREARGAKCQVRARMFLDGVPGDLDRQRQVCGGRPRTLRNSDVFLLALRRSRGSVLSSITQS